MPFSRETQYLKPKDSLFLCCPNVSGIPICRKAEFISGKVQNSSSPKNSSKYLNCVQNLNDLGVKITPWHQKECCDKVSGMWKNNQCDQ